jgi:ribosome biogenesis protein MAK21
LDDEKMPPKPDLASHTLANFLDRFVYRNAKAAAGAPKGSSIMQPLAGGDSRGIFVSSRGAQVQQSVNSEAFWRKKAEDVAVDEVFFHKYFSQIGKGKQSAKKKETKKGALDDDEEDEDEIWQALVESKPDIEGPDDDDDDDLDMDDFDMSEDEETDGGVDIEGEGGDEDVDMEDIDEDEGDESPGIFDEDEDDLKGSDDEAGSDLDQLFEKELQRAAGTEKEGKKKETSREKKRRLKNLPTFASADDYAAMLDGDGDGDEDTGK